MRGYVCAKSAGFAKFEMTCREEQKKFGPDCILSTQFPGHFAQNEARVEPETGSMSATHIHATVRATQATRPRAQSRGVSSGQPSRAVVAKTSARCGLSSRRALRGDAVSIRGGSDAIHVSRSASRKSAVVIAAAGGASQPAAAKGRMCVAISGASGFVGSRLVAKLLAGGHEVRVLTRDVNAARMALRGSMTGGNVTFVSPEKWAAAIPGCTGVVNLAGEPISTRWNPAIKAEIMASRIKATKRIADAIAACEPDERPSVLVNASAIGFYGTSETRIFSEDAPAGGDYLSKVCQAWENTAEEVEKTCDGSTRVVLLRLGIVLDRDGGALGKMLPTFQIFAGGPMGDGAQWFSWVHREDAVGIVVESLTNGEMRGPVNVTAPNPVRMGEMCDALGRTLGRPSWLPVPDFAIQALLGEGATVVLQGQKVAPSAALKAGYKFKYETIDEAFHNILR